MKKKLLGLLDLLIVLKNDKKLPKKYKRELNLYIQQIKEVIENEKLDESKFKFSFTKLLGFLTRLFTDS